MAKDNGVRGSLVVLLMLLAVFLILLGGEGIAAGQEPGAVPTQETAAFVDEAVVPVDEVIVPAGEMAAAEDEPEWYDLATRAVVVTVLILLGGVALGLIGFLVDARKILQNDQRRLFTQLDNHPALLAVGQSLPGQVMHGALEKLIEQVDDPDDVFVQGLTKTLLKLDVTNTLLKRYPKLKPEQGEVEQIISGHLEAILSQVAGLLDGKASNPAQPSDSLTPRPPLHPGEGE